MKGNKEEDIKDKVVFVKDKLSTKPWFIVYALTFELFLLKQQTLSTS